ncbi:hypothetical protein Tco_0955200 [Tanacetum coccineum]|uniref:Uncharacterized protein n=1 Tax=Tanacetum coccineum TaxID=301880 RepID=A0ABQ5E6H8_9ASTR
MEQAQQISLKHTSKLFPRFHLHEALMRHHGKILSLFVNVSAQTRNRKHWKPVLKLEYETTWQHTRKKWRGLKMRSSNNEKKSMIGGQRCSATLKNSTTVLLQKSASFMPDTFMQGKLTHRDKRIVKFSSVPGDGVRIFPDGVTSPDL